MGDLENNLHIIDGNDLFQDVENPENVQFNLDKMFDNVNEKPLYQEIIPEEDKKRYKALNKKFYKLMKDYRLKAVNGNLVFTDNYGNTFEISPYYDDKDGICKRPVLTKGNSDIDVLTPEMYEENIQKAEFFLKTGQYDRLLYGEYLTREVIFVEKNGLYGVINKNGDEIISCKYAEYSDAYGEWREMGFPTTKPKALTPEQGEKDNNELSLQATKEKLQEQGHINRISFYNGRAVNGTAFVKLPNGKTGMAASLMVWESERGKNLEILDENGEHLMFIDEPELLQGTGTPHLVITSDDENLYVGSYNTSYSYLAAYEMGSFKRKWKTPMCGSKIQSVTVNDNYLIAFDMNDGKIKYFDKTNGQQLKGKDIDVNGKDSVSHHDLAATNELLFAAVPGLEEMILDCIPAFNNELKIFDNNKAELVEQSSFSAAMGSLSAIAVDPKKGRAFLAIGNKIGVFDNTGYIGMIPVSTRNIIKMDFDSKTGRLMVSIKEGVGKVEILDEQAINLLLKESKKLLKSMSVPEKQGYNSIRM